MYVCELYKIAEDAQVIKLHLYNCSVSAGFPPPADDYINLKLDLNAYLIKRPACTFLARASGQSMIKAGIHTGDLLVVDRSIDPSDSRIVIAVINGESTVKRIKYKNDMLYLLAENDAYEPISVKEFTDSLFIWGVATSVIHPLL